MAREKDGLRTGVIKNLGLTYGEEGLSQDPVLHTTDSSSDKLQVASLSQNAVSITTKQLLTTSLGRQETETCTECLCTCLPFHSGLSSSSLVLVSCIMCCSEGFVYKNIRGMSSGILLKFRWSTNSIRTRYQEGE